MVVLLAAGWAQATQLTEPGGGFLTKKKQNTKDYYVVRKGNSDQCAVQAGKWAKKPEGAIGSPYASKDYAKAALKTFPECKGGEADESTGGKKHNKK